MIIVSESREDVGNDDFDLIFTDYDNNADREASLRNRFTIGGYMGYHTAIIAEENRVLMVTSLDQNKIDKMGMTKVTSLTEALDIVTEQNGGDLPPAYIMPHGATTLPIQSNI